MSILCSPFKNFITLERAQGTWDKQFAGLLAELGAAGIALSRALAARTSVKAFREATM